MRWYLEFFFFFDKCYLEFIRSIREAFPALILLVTKKLQWKTIWDWIIALCVGMSCLLDSSRIEGWRCYACSWTFFIPPKLKGMEKNECWFPTKSGVFEVKYYFKVLFNRSPYFFPWKSIWRKMALIRVAFFHLDSY